MQQLGSSPPLDTLLINLGPQPETPYKSNYFEINSEGLTNKLAINVENYTVRVLIYYCTEEFSNPLIF